MFFDSDDDDDLDNDFLQNSDEGRNIIQVCLISLWYFFIHMKIVFSPINTIVENRIFSNKRDCFARNYFINVSFPEISIP